MTAAHAKLSAYAREVERLKAALARRDAEIATADKVIDDLLEVPAEHWDATRRALRASMDAILDQIKEHA